MEQTGTGRISEFGVQHQLVLGDAEVGQFKDGVDLGLAGAHHLFQGRDGGGEKTARNLEIAIGPAFDFDDEFIALAVSDCEILIV